MSLSRAYRPSEWLGVMLAFGLLASVTWADSGPADLLALTPLPSGYLQFEYDTDGDGRADQYTIYKILSMGWNDESNDTLQLRANREQIGIVAVEPHDRTCPLVPQHPIDCEKARYLYVVKREPVRTCRTLPCEVMD